MIYARATIRSGGLIPQSNIQYVGGALNRATSTSNYSVSLTSLSGGIDTRPRAGDTIIVFTANRGDTSGDVPLNTTGYTRLTASGWDTPVNGVFYKTATGSETSISIDGRALPYQPAITLVQVWRGVNELSFTGTTGRTYPPDTICPPGGVVVGLAMDTAASTNFDASARNLDHYAWLSDSIYYGGSDYKLRTAMAAARIPAGGLVEFAPWGDGTFSWKTATIAMTTK